MSNILSVQNLTKIYSPQRKIKKETVAVNKVSFNLQAGEILGLLGPNGAGKSTIISMLLGVLTPTSGNITIFDKDFSKYRSNILQNMTFASTYVRMPWRLTIIENLRVYGLFYGLNKKIFKERVEELLTKFGVWDHRHKIMSELSAGQITRVILAKAFLSKPKIVLLDEPTASLDPDIAHLVRQFVLEQQERNNLSIIYTSHNMEEVSSVCNRIIFLRQGKIVAENTPDKLAKSIETCQIVLKILNKDQQTRLIRITDILKLKTIHNKQAINIIIKEKDIASFLQKISKENIEYNQINIKKPTLEDYFLKMAK